MEEKNKEWDDFLTKEVEKNNTNRIEVARILDRYIVGFSLGTFVLTGALSNWVENPTLFTKWTLTISLLCFLTSGLAGIISYQSIYFYYEARQKLAVKANWRDYKDGLDSVEKGRAIRCNVWMNRIKLGAFCLAFLGLLTVQVWSLFATKTPNNEYTRQGFASKERYKH